MILVTGGSGFVGRSLVAALSKRTEAVRVLTRTASSVTPREGVSVVVGDLLDASSLQRAARGARAIVHLAARVPSGQGAEDDLLAWNVHSTAALAAAALHEGVDRFVHVSSAGVYGDGTTATLHTESDRPAPGNAYERSKLEAEQAIQSVFAASPVRWTMLRPAGIYGPGRPATTAFLAQVRAQRLWLHGPSNVIVHPTHVSDVVQALVGVLEASDDLPPVLNVAGDRALSYQEFIGLTASAMDVRVRQVTLPAAIGRPVARVLTAALRAGRAPVPLGLERAARAWINRGVDTTLARRTLGFSPIPLEAGIAETVGARGQKS